MHESQGIPSCDAVGGGRRQANCPAQGVGAPGTECGDGVTADKCQAPRQRQQVLYLVAAVLIAQAPLAEVLAVVCEDSIAVLAEAGARPARHLGSIEARLSMGSYPDPTSLREARERDLFHGDAA